MSSPTENASPIVRFFDSFLQEKNIKWLLGIGTLLVLSSSLCMIAPHWGGYPPLWKYAVISAYTIAIFFGGEISYWRLALHKTGSGLMALTVLLLPISFFALHWVEPTENVSLDYFAMHVPIAALAVGNLALTYWAAKRIFGHFLRGSQPTFLASYLILCAAGAVLPALPGTWTPWIGFVLWGVFTAGVIKVNRHVFWLTEEERLPRIFGFFPIGLLGAQLLALAAVHLSRFVPTYLPWEWLGFACVAVAIPVLLTADTVARVTQERTGGLLPSIPWSIVMPFGVGVLLVFAGVSLATIGMPRPHALPPTALLAAGMMALVARRTQSKFFVWAMLLLITLSYNFSPVFFQELAASAVKHGAHSVREARLPYAFYGLTYLPLLLALTVGSRFLAKRSELFAQPMRLTAQALAMLLLMAGCGHPKAMFPVACVMLGVFALQTVVFRNRWLLVAAAIALIAAGIGWTPFASQLLQFNVNFETPFLAMAVVGLLLLVPGRWVDSASQSLVQAAESIDLPMRGWNTWPICQIASVLVACLTTLSLFVGQGSRQALDVLFGPTAGSPFPATAAACLCLLMLAQAVILVWPVLGELALVSPLALALLFGWEHGADVQTLGLGATMVLLGYWLFSYLQAAAPRLRLAQALATPAYRVSLTGLALLLCADYAPQLFRAHFIGIGGVRWLATLAVATWCFDAGRRSGVRELLSLGCYGVLGLVSAAVAAELGVEHAAIWYPAAWAGTASAAMCVLLLAREYSARVAGTRPAPFSTINQLPFLYLLDQVVFSISSFVLLSTALFSLAAIGTPARIAGGLALLGLGLKAIADGRPRFHADWIILANWQLMALVIQCCHADSRWIWQTTLGQAIECALPVALCASLSRLATLHRRIDRALEPNPLMQLHSAGLALLAAAALVLSQLQIAGHFGVVSIAMAAASFAILAGGQLLLACRRRSEARVWQAIGIAGLAVLYFENLGLIHFGHGWGSYALLGTGITAWTLGRGASQSLRMSVLARPFIITGLTLPLGCVGLAVGRFLLGMPTLWLGMNSLALFLTAGFYFWRGIEQRQNAFVVGSAAIVNLALALLWCELHWSDPQWFMIPAGVSILTLVEFMKRDIPTPYLDPLRYFGALVILVSPTFHIVEGSWLHLLSLMVASVAVFLMSIGLRVRALMYMGTGFLLVDLTAMVVRKSVEQPNVLWIVGIALGALVIGVAAAAENHREVLLQRVRMLAANINQWE